MPGTAQTVCGTVVHHRKVVRGHWLLWMLPLNWEIEVQLITTFFLKFKEQKQAGAELGQA